MAYLDQEGQKKRNLMFLLGMFLFIGGIGGGYYLLHSGQYNEQTPAAEPSAASETLASVPSPSVSASPDKGAQSSKDKPAPKGAELRTLLDNAGKPDNP